MTARRPRVAFFLPDLGGGGAERLTIDLMAGMLARGHAVDLVLQRHHGELLALVPPGVTVVDLGAIRLRQTLLPLARYLRRERPAALFATMWPLTVLALVANRLAGTHSRVIVTEHCSLRHEYAALPRTLAVLRATVRLTYRHAAAIVAVSTGLADELAELAGVAPQRIRVIANPVPAPLRSAADPEQLWPGRPGARLLTVGALKPAKDHALLIEAFAQVIASGEDAVLAIVGSGSLEAALRRQIARLGLGERVLLPGFTRTPGDWYAGADLFVLSSTHEGFGNVLVEALHAGLPVVATDCPFGPREVLGGGRFGRLPPPGDAARLAEAIRAALAAPGDPSALRRRAAEFSPHRAVAAYAALVPGA